MTDIILTFSVVTWQRSGNTESVWYLGYAAFQGILTPQLPSQKMTLPLSEPVIVDKDTDRQTARMLSWATLS